MTLPIKLATGIIGLSATNIVSLKVYHLTLPKDVRHQIEKNNKKILDTTSSTSVETSQDYEKWKKIVEADSGNKAKTFAKWGDTDNDTKAKVTKLKEACEQALGTPYRDPAFKDQLSNAEEFCIDKND